MTRWLLIAASLVACCTAACCACEATGRASRSLTSDESIARLIAGTALGVIQNVSNGTTWDSGAGRTAWDSRNMVGSLLSGLEIKIDGHPQHGLLAWLAAAWRIAGYVADLRHDGSVVVSNTGPIAGLVVTRTTTIEDGHVQIQAWFVKTEVQRGKRIPVSVHLILDGAESFGRTTVTGCCTGSADLSAFHCRFIRRIATRIARREIPAGLATALCLAEQRGRELHAAGHVDLHARLGLAVEAVKRTSLIGR